MAYSLKNIAILSAKVATFRCLLMGISKNEGLKRLNNSIHMIEDYCKYECSSKFDDYSISPKIRHILLHWGYELTEKDFFNALTN